MTDFPRDDVYQAAADGRTRTAIDLVLDWVDDALEAGRRDDVAAALAELEADRLTPAIAYAVTVAAGWGGLSAPDGVVELASEVGR